MHGMVDKAWSEVETFWSFKAISTKGIDALAIGCISTVAAVS
jgi:hypothetical protein